MSLFTERIVEEYAVDRDKYNFFDVNCWWDYTDNKTFHGLESFEQLEEELKTHHIKRAVITSYASYKYDTMKANEELAELIDDKKNLYGCMVLVPELAYSDGAITNYIDKKIEKGFVCSRMFPKTLRHSMKKWAVGEILDYLEERRFPLILWHNEMTWDTIEGLCDEYKNLPIIIEGNDVKLLYHNRNYIPLLKKYENLYLETHNIVLYEELDFLANQISSKKLIFGTYFPYNTPNATMMAVTKGNFSEDAKYDIAARNLDRLINEIR
ncbi:MAG: hypothetical protein PHP79_01135 [Clostridia bacterium]|nr:hypothetical protein [Clostridia bacterium]